MADHLRHGAGFPSRETDIQLVARSPTRPIRCSESAASRIPRSSTRPSTTSTWSAGRSRSGVSSRGNPRFGHHRDDQHLFAVHRRGGQGRSSLDRLDHAGDAIQETLTNFPDGSEVLTGLFLNVTLSGPQGASETFSRSLVDLIGFAARQQGGTSTVSVNAGGQPAINSYDLTTLDILASATNPIPSAALDAELAKDSAQIAAASAAESSRGPGGTPDRSREQNQPAARRRSHRPVAVHHPDAGERGRRRRVFRSAPDCHGDHPRHARYDDEYRQHDLVDPPGERLAARHRRAGTNRIRRTSSTWRVGCSRISRSSRSSPD